jgi:hypothetical protein
MNRLVAAISRIEEALSAGQTASLDDFEGVLLGWPEPERQELFLRLAIPVAMVLYDASQYAGCCRLLLLCQQNHISLGMRQFELAYVLIQESRHNEAADVISELGPGPGSFSAVRFEPRWSFLDPQFRTRMSSAYNTPGIQAGSRARNTSNTPMAANCCGALTGNIPALQGISVFARLISGKFYSVKNLVLISRKIRSVSGLEVTAGLSQASSLPRTTLRPWTGESKCPLARPGGPRPA